MLTDQTEPMQTGVEHRDGDGRAQPPTRPQPMYGVVLDLPEEFREEIAAKRERYCPQAARSIFPHITLRAPFTTDDPKPLAHALESVALRHLPVQVRASELGSFVGPRNNVLYVKVERSDRLMRLHEAVVGALPDVRNVYPDAPSHQFENWVPHITIAFGMPVDELDGLMRLLEDYHPAHEWEARELLMVRSQSAEDGSILWTTTRAFRLPT